MKILFNILLLLILFNVQTLSQRQLFFSLSVQDGLSDSDVNCIIQDRKGFLWIGTESGLNRYDGYEFKVFKNNQNDPGSLPYNSIWSLYEDRAGYIWIGTKNGDLIKFSPFVEKFTPIEFTDSENSGNSITSIMEDAKGNIWFGTYSKGLFRYQVTSGQITNWQYEEDKPIGLSNNYITSLLLDKNGGIWISTYNGLNYLNPDKNKITVFKNIKNNVNSIPGNLVWKILQSKYDNNLLFICTSDGLCTYNLISKKFEQINFNIEFPSQFSKSIASIVEDRSDGRKALWIATYGGIYHLDLNTHKSKQYVADKKNISGLLNNQIDQIIIDKSGVLWLATDNGLNYLPATTKKINYIFSEYLTQPLVQDLLNADIKTVLSIDSSTTILGSNDGMFSVIIKNNEISVTKIDKLSNLNIWSLEKGEGNSIWIGTYGKGLYNYNFKTQTLVKYPIVSPTFQTSAFEYIKALRLSKDGTLWIGFWGGGLAALNIYSGKYNIWINNKEDQNSLSFNDVWYIHLDKFGRVWIATNGGGLNLFLPKNNGEFLRWTSTASEKSDLLNNSVQCLAEGESDIADETILYIGTDVGLNKMTIKNRSDDIYNFDVSFNILSNQLNISDASIRSIVVSLNELWLSTNKGIYKYNIDSKELLDFRISEGYGSEIFNSGAGTRMINNNIVFGSVKGPAFFNPGKIKQSDYEPNIVLTDLLIFNKSISIKDNTILDSIISYSNQIRLASNENAISFKFSSLDFNSRENIKYAYKMEGFDKDWIYSSTSNIAVYTNLNPGSYVFKIRGTNSDGRWGVNEAEIGVIIKYPWWRTGWAYAIFVIAILSILFLIRRFEINRTKLRNELRNLEFETKKQKEIETLKSRFFANISHEFRTPLMLIKGPLEQLLLKKGSADEHIRLAYNNTEKLKLLIDQLLDISKLESNLIPLNASEEDLSTLLKGFVISFKSITEQKEISLTIDCPEEKCIALVDRDKFEKIINNLLSNAYKFTSKKGSISVSLKKRISVEKVFYDIIVKDSGIGIDKDKLDKIFDRFFQVDDSSIRSYGGSGIGLSLVKELADLHHWSISVKSSIGVGTEFLLSIPGIEADKLKDISDDQKTFNSSNNFIDSLQEIKVDDSGTTEVYSDKKEIVLLVEDSQEVRQYLKGILYEDYNILEAENGKRGIEIASEKSPDLIISDVMMPIMDGFEFCQKIKTDIQTSHIPVILLTAKASSESKIEGLETGADDYLTKPFHSRELLVRVKNLLDIRKKLKEKFSKDIDVKPANLVVNKLDEEFLSKAFQVTEKNIDKPEFDTEQFAKEMFLSRSQLHRKLLAITGHTPGEFVRTFRLKKAASLILEKRLSVTQIAFEVGFNSPSHFSKAFRQQFNCLPTEFTSQTKI